MAGSKVQLKVMTQRNFVSSGISLLPRLREPESTMGWIAVVTVPLLYASYKNFMGLGGFELAMGTVQLPRIFASFAIALFAIWAHFFTQPVLDRRYVLHVALALPLIILPTAITAIAQYGQPLSILARSIIPFLALLLFSSLRSLQLGNRQVSVLLGILTGIEIGMATLAIGVATGFVPESFLHDAVGSRRSDSLRVGDSFLVGIQHLWLFAIACAKVLGPSTKRTRACWLLVALVFLYYDIFVSMTRNHVLCEGLSFMAIAAYYAITSARLGPRLVLVAIPCVLMLLPYAGIPLIDWSLGEGALRDANTAIRIDGLAYYWRLFVETGGIGFGVVRSLEGPDNPVSAGMGLGYSFADLGLFGVLFQFGVVAVVLNYSLIVCLLRDLGRILKRRNDPIVLGLLIFACQLAVFPNLNTILFKDNYSFEWALFIYFAWKFTKSDGGIGVASEGAKPANIRSEQIACRL